MGQELSVIIELESPLHPEAAQLVDALDAYLADLYPGDSKHLPSVEALATPSVRFLIARSSGVAVGCGALRIDLEGYGEIRRMYVSPQARGKGVGRLLLEQLEALARDAGLRSLRLETGISQEEALGLYRRAGYVECPPFSEYQVDSLSVFMEKRL